MQQLRLHNQKGFTLPELVLVIIIIGIISAVAYREMSSQIETAKFENTLTEMEQISYAIAGNPNLYDKGRRSDFGYIGDIGALPPNLDALVSNPGLSNWNGPYLSTNVSDNSYKQDGWNNSYTYIDTLLRSTGSGSNIDRMIAPNSAALLNNNLTGFIVDVDQTGPGNKKDSLRLELIYPDGSGGSTTATKYPTADGSFSYTNLPVGNHILRMIYLSATDTTSLIVTVNPSSDNKIRLVYPADIF